MESLQTLTNDLRDRINAELAAKFQTQQQVQVVHIRRENGLILSASVVCPNCPIHKNTKKLSVKQRRHIQTSHFHTHWRKRHYPANPQAHH